MENQNELPASQDSVRSELPSLSPVFPQGSTDAIDVDAIAEQHAASAASAQHTQDEETADEISIDDPSLSPSLSAEDDDDFGEGEKGGREVAEPVDRVFPSAGQTVSGSQHVMGEVVDHSPYAGRALTLEERVTALEYAERSPLEDRVVALESDMAKLREDLEHHGIRGKQS